MFRFEIVKDEFRKHPQASILMPRRSTKNACAYDFHSPESFVLNPGEIHMVWTDVKAKIPDRYMLMLNVRSSMGKHLIRMANTQGWVDADYYGNSANDGNIGVMLHNAGSEPYEVNEGDRIAQGMIVKYYTVDDDYTETIREGGFGSTSK